MKETVQDSRYENLVRLLDKMGDRLANVVDVVEDFQRKQSSRNGDRDQSRENYKNRDRRKNQQRSGTSQRHFDNNEFCNYCNRVGHTTHRCYKLENYLKKKGRKITLHEEEDIQELHSSCKQFCTILKCILSR